MQEIITKVLEAEKAAEARIQEARSKAGEIRARAEGEVEAKVQEARDRAGKRSQEILSRSRGQAQEEYEEAVEKARNENQAFFQSHEEDINRAVESVLALITLITLTTSPEWAQE